MMKKILLMTLLPISVFGLSSCDRNVRDHNPHNVMNGRYHEFTLTMNNKEYYISSSDEIVDSLKNKILDAGTFKNTSSTSNSYKSFTYQVERSVMMWGRVRYKMQFFYDGYVNVYVDKYNDERKKLPDYYSYQFDKYKAEDLYNTVVNYADERDRILEEELEARNAMRAAASKEAEDKIAAFTINDVINDLKKKQKLTVSFYYLNSAEDYSYFDNELEDDGSIVNEIINATYSKIGTIDRQINVIRTCIVGVEGSVTLDDYKQPITYSLNIVGQPSYVELSTSTNDSYGAAHNYRTKYSIDNESLTSLFDTAINVYEQKHNKTNGEA